jgi:hypothetical protein
MSSNLSYRDHTDMLKSKKQKKGIFIPKCVHFLFLANRRRQELAGTAGVHTSRIPTDPGPIRSERFELTRTFSPGALTQSLTYDNGELAAER